MSVPRVTWVVFLALFFWLPLTVAESAGQQPGVEPYSEELAARLEAALAAMGTAYEPRTHHKSEDGKPHFTNRLILENSPYLLQHAHNPVDWYAWGDGAFD